MTLLGKRVLVIGGAGFIGSHLVEALAARDVAHLVVVDSLWLGREEHLTAVRERRPGLVFVREDATEFFALREIVKRERVDTVFNLATRPLGYSFVSPRTAYEINVTIAANLAELLREGAFERLVQYSTSEVYGDALHVPMDESHPLRPTTPYAAGKLSADHLLASYQALFGVRVLTVRPFNNYGPRQNTGAYGAVIPFTIAQIRSGRAPILEGDGSQSRDFTLVTDTARVTVALCECDEAWGQVVNVSAGDEVPIASVVEQISRSMGYAGPLDRRPERKGDHRRHAAGTALMHRLLPDVRFTPFIDGIAATIAWYDSQRAGR